MKGICLLLIFTTLTIASFAQKSVKGKWFESRSWQNNLSVKPSAAIDAKEFRAHYRKYPARWEIIFDYIKEHDMLTLPVGATQLSDDVSIRIQEYDTNVPSTKPCYEKHTKMIDVQYIISGRELHGTVKIDRAKECIPYKAKSDVAGYNAENVPYQVMSAGEYSIFFPDDVHLTNIGFGNKTRVRKAVFKVKAE